MTETPPEIDIRAARPGDAEAIAAMQCLPGFRHGTLRPPFVTPEMIRARLEAPFDGHSLVACVAGQVVGQIGLHRQGGRRAHVGDIGMGVHDAWTRRGIGTRLMAEAVTVADRWLGLRRLELTVYTDNAAALALYRRFGFTVEGTHRGYALRDGVLVDAHSMARMVAPPACEG
ncbi:MAG: GNAT family N-acetyltransferase [Alphaproteobacteria bacterium]|nr:GNAT family N-acetyltransferase [Alphaproteobacteria bacterium]